MFSPFKVAKQIAEFMAGDNATGAFKFDGTAIARSIVRQKEAAEFSPILSALQNSGRTYTDEAINELKGLAGTISRENLYKEALGEGNTAGITVQQGAKKLDDIDAYKDLIANYRDTTKGSGQLYNDWYQHGQTKQLASAYLGHKNGKFTAGETFEGFFGDPDVGEIRQQAGLAAYGATALGVRFLSGGDLTHNSRGENDIAGIPFF